MEAAGLRVAVTGASGFVGRHLVAELGRRGFQAIAVRGALAPDTERARALRSCGAVVHLAAAAHEAAERCERAGDYETLRSLNAIATERLAREAHAAGVERFVFISTIGVHGEETHGAPFTEESVFAPRSLYARSKLEAEERLAAVVRDTGLVVTVLRPTLVYGPGNPGNMLRLLRLLDSGLPLPLACIQNRRSLTYVGNLVAAIHAVLQQPGLNEAFIVCDTDAVSTPELVRALRAAMGRPARLFAMPAGVVRIAAAVAGQGAAARRLLGSLEADASRLRRATGWSPPFSASEGIERTGTWYRTEVTSLRGRP